MGCLQQGERKISDRKVGHGESFNERWLKLLSFCGLRRQERRTGLNHGLDKLEWIYGGTSKPTPKAKKRHPGSNKASSPFTNGTLTPIIESRAMTSEELEAS